MLASCAGASRWSQPACGSSGGRLACGAASRPGRTAGSIPTGSRCQVPSASSGNAGACLRHCSLGDLLGYAQHGPRSGSPATNAGRRQAGASGMYDGIKAAAEAFRKRRPKATVKVDAGPDDGGFLADDSELPGGAASRAADAPPGGLPERIGLIGVIPSLGSPAFCPVRPPRKCSRYRP